jgi:HEPN domain-containing protein
MRDPKIEGARWLEQAEYDLATAEWDYKGERWPAVCFNAQQAAEKAVKAYLYAAGERIVLGHSVVELLEQAGRKNPEFLTLVQAAKILDRYYVPTRYPNGLPGGIGADVYGKEDADQALELAKTVVDFVKGAM